MTVLKDLGQQRTFEGISRVIVAILEDMTSDWDMAFSDPINENTKLVGDLEFESIDVVQYVVAIEEYYKKRNLPFEEMLMKEGRYVDEITVRDTVNFLMRYLNGA